MDKEADQQNSPACRELEVGGSSFSTLFIKRNQDYSFSDGSPVSFNGQPGTPAFTCKSSLSSFLVENGSPYFESEGFSFTSCCQSTSAEFSSPITSLPSFTFFSPISAVEPLNVSVANKAKTSEMSAEYRGICFRFVLGMEILSV